MPGYAFSIEDALIASRWAEQILSRGYRVVITPGYKNAEEVIEVYIPKAKMPTFTVRRTSHSVMITDCIGLTLSFLMLSDALLAIAPLSRSEKREMLKGASPAWLPDLMKRRNRSACDIRSQISSAAASIAAWFDPVLKNWLRTRARG